MFPARAGMDRHRSAVVAGEFLDEFISAEERRDAERHARRDQRELNGIKAQIGVVKAGPELWEDALAWGTEWRMLTPTEKQSVRAVEALRKLQAERYAGELPPGS